MSDVHQQKLAELIVSYCVSIHEGDIVYIEGQDVASPLLLEVYKKVLQRGGIPILNSILGEQNYIFFKYASIEQLKSITPFEELITSDVDVAINIKADSNLKRLTNIDPERISIRKKAQSHLMDAFMSKQASGKLRWVIAPYPCESMAQEASMSVTEYEEFVYSACHLDEGDPVAYWKNISRSQERICRYLNKKSNIRIVGDDTDLSFDVSGRKWINCDGDNNMPDGEVFTGPIEDSAEGEIRFTYPGIFQGKEIEDIKLTFKNGEVVGSSASKGEGFLKRLLKTDEGIRRIGEAAIGTNYGITKFTKNMLFDEKIGGTVHIALGAAYPETMSTNKSALHWDMLKDMKANGRIYADDELVYENGAMLI